MAKLDMDARAGGPEEWATVLDKLLLGVTHNISNRVATLAGVSDILSGDPTIPPILRALADEVPRLEESIRLLRLLAEPDDEEEEALEATRATDDAIALARLHPACLNVRFEIEGRREAPPVIARPTSLTHEIVVALVSAASVASAVADSDGDTGGPVTSGQVQITFSSDADDLLISAGPSVVRARLLSARRN
jgi:hypothetical protein